MRSHPTFWTALTKLGFPRKQSRSSKTPQFGRRLRFEQCEDRRMLATITVNSFLDNGDDANTTLREAIVQANIDDLPDTIQFDPTVFNTPKTIALTQGQLTISESVTIDATVDGTGPSNVRLGITIDAGDTTTQMGDGIRIFNITDPTNGTALVTLKGLTLKGGDPVRNSGNQFGNGGAIFSTSRLVIVDCTIEENDAYSGGGIHIKVAGGSATTPRNVLTIQDSVIQNNQADSGGGTGRSFFRINEEFVTIAA